MNKRAWAIAKLNLKNIKVPYVVMGVVLLALLVQDVIMLITSGDFGEQISISIGNTLWLLIPLAAILIATKNLRRIVNLGGKRSHYFIGGLATYPILAAAVSLANVLIFYTYDRIITNTEHFKGIINLMDVFGWAAHGPIIAFFQQFAFLFLLAVFTHTLTMLQDSWVGWTADVLIVAIISVFTPIEPLRAVLYNFFRMILFHPSALLQIITCVALAAGLYALSYPVLSRKKL